MLISRRTALRALGGLGVAAGLAACASPYTDLRLSLATGSRNGAYDYLLKPTDPEQLSASLNRVRERLALRRRVRSLTAALSARDALQGLVSGGPAMRAVLESARRASQVPA